MDSLYPSVGLCYTHNNSADNLIRGLGERLCMVPTDDGFALPPRPVPGIFQHMQEYRRRVVAKCPKPIGPISHDEFVMLYDGPKRKRYAAAAKALLDRDLEQRDWEINVFIKDETICSWSKTDPAPRLISPRSPEFCLELGCFLKPVEHYLYKAVARVWGETTIAKGLNFNQRGQLIHDKWTSFKEPVAIGLDASRFDQHVSTDALKWEHGFYTALYPQSKKLPFLLRKQLVNTGRAYVDDKKIEYSVEGSRMSGDCNTALGNCLIMTGLVHTYLQDREIHGKLINDGDDCVVFIESTDLDRFMHGLKEWFRDYGFTMKVETPVYNIEEIEFCQCHPVWNGHQYSMCRNVHKALYTDVAHVGRTAREIEQIRESVSQCGLVWSRGFPVFPSFYRSLSTGATPRVMYNSGTYWNAKGCVSGTAVVTARARDSFALAFGISAAEQMALEEQYDNIPRAEFKEPHQIFAYDPLIPSTEYPLQIDQAHQVVVHGKIA